MDRDAGLMLLDETADRTTHDAELGSHALPPAGLGPDVGFRQPNEGSVQRHALQGPVDKMHLLRPYRQWQDRTEFGGQERIPGRPSLSGNRQDLRGLPWVRCGSHQAIEARRRRCARQHAMADEGGGKGQGQGRVGDDVTAKEECRIAFPVVPFASIRTVW